MFLNVLSKSVSKNPMWSKVTRSALELLSLILEIGHAKFSIMKWTEYFAVHLRSLAHFIRDSPQFVDRPFDS